MRTAHLAEKRKVLAYITRQITGTGRQLLVFTHPLSPEAGIQVPGGTVEPGEDTQTAVLRETQEETGLSGLKIVSFLGDYKQDIRPFGKDEMHHRFIYHLICTQNAPDEWRHGESDPSEGAETFIPLDFYWVDLPDGVPPLAGEQDKMIDRLLTALG